MRVGVGVGVGVGVVVGVGVGGCVRACVGFLVHTPVRPSPTPAHQLNARHIVQVLLAECPSKFTAELTPRTSGHVPRGKGPGTSHGETQRSRCKGKPNGKPPFGNDT